MEITFSASHRPRQTVHLMRAGSQLYSRWTSLSVCAMIRFLFYSTLHSLLNHKPVLKAYCHQKPWSTLLRERYPGSNPTLIIYCFTSSCPPYPPSYAEGVNHVFLSTAWQSVKKRYTDSSPEMTEVHWQLKALLVPSLTQWAFQFKWIVIIKRTILSSP